MPFRCRCCCCRLPMKRACGRMRPGALPEPTGRLPLFLRELKGVLYTGLLGLKISVFDLVAELLSCACNLSLTCRQCPVNSSCTLKPTSRKTHCCERKQTLCTSSVGSTPAAGWSPFSAPICSTALASSRARLLKNSTGGSH